MKRKRREEKEKKEEEVAAALDSNDVTREQVDTYACDHAKHGREKQIASDKHKDPVSEVIDGCESAKNVLDNIEKDDTDVTGQKEIVGGSVQVENKFKINFHMIILTRMQIINQNTNQTPRLVQKILKDQNQKRKDGGDASINVPGDNVQTDVISPREGASDEKK